MNINTQNSNKDLMPTTNLDLQGGNISFLIKKEIKLRWLQNSLILKLRKRNYDRLKPLYTKAISMQELLRSTSTIQQPGSLTHTYLYNYDKSKQYKFSKLINYICLILNSTFATLFGLISRPVYLFTQNKLIIYINYYIPNYFFYKKSKSHKIIKRHVWKYNKWPASSTRGLTTELTKLIKVLSNLLNLKVELQLNQLKYPYQDSSILAKLISLNTNKKRFGTIIRIIMKKALVITNELITDKTDNQFSNTGIKILKNRRRKLLWWFDPKVDPETGLAVIDPKTGSEVMELHVKKFTVYDKVDLRIHKTIPAILTGLKVQISGRLKTERVIPKKTIQKKEIGGFKRTKENIVDYAIYTNKNKRGAYSVKVWTTSKISV